MNIKGGAFTWADGNLTGGGLLDILNNGTLLINPGAGKTIDIDNGFAIQNAAFVTWQSGTIDIGGSVAAGSPITNNGIFDIQGDFNLTDSIQGESPVFTNSGTLKKSAGNGIANLAIGYTGAGTVTVASGEIDFLGYTFK
jgi:hypothetical protein